MTWYVTTKWLYHSNPCAVRCSLRIGLFSKLVKMENPYKEPQKGCVLCNVTVDYKNIQVSLVTVIFKSARLNVTFTIPSNDHYHKMWFLPRASPTLIPLVFWLKLLCTSAHHHYFYKHSPVWSTAPFPVHLTSHRQNLWPTFHRWATAEIRIPSADIFISLLQILTVVILGLCGVKQKQVAKAIKKAQSMGEFYM